MPNKDYSDVNPAGGRGGHPGLKENDGREKGRAPSALPDIAGSKSVGVEPNEGAPKLDGSRPGID